MRFKRELRYEPITWTERKAKAALSKPLREMKKNLVRYPLFGDQLEASPVVNIEDEITRRQAMSDDLENRLRSLYARTWRDARRQYFSCNPIIKKIIRDAWDRWAGPLTSSNFIYVVEQHNGVAKARNIAINERDRLLREKLQLEEKSTKPLPF